MNVAYLNGQTIVSKVGVNVKIKNQVRNQSTYGSKKETDTYVIKASGGCLLKI